MRKPDPSITTRPPSTAAGGRMPVMWAGEALKELRVVELEVPVQVVAPALGCLADPDGDPQGRRRRRALRQAPEVHAGLGGSTPALLPIAVATAGDDVLPVLPPALRHGNDVVEGELARRKHLAAVLARVVVASVDVGPRERHVVEAPLDLDVAQQANDRRQLDAERNGANLAVVDVDD